jgi:coproporphyrinogen III oxidase
MVEEKNDELKHEIELGYCTRHAAFPVDHGVQEVEQDLGAFGKSKKKIRIVTQEFARCVGELCETSWCNIHQTCRDICDHNEVVHGNETDKIIGIFSDILTKRKVENTDEILAEVDSMLYPEETISGNIVRNSEITEENEK